MERQTVESSTINSIGWRPWHTGATKEEILTRFSNKTTKEKAKYGKLEIEFDYGRIYEYYDVPETVFAALLSAESIGRTFNKIIRGKYQWVKLFVSAT